MIRPIHIVPFLLLCLLGGQGLIPLEYQVSAKRHRAVVSDGLKSNIISEIRLQTNPHRVWLGTGRGIAVVNDSASVVSLDTMRVTGEGTVIQEDGISAIGVKGTRVYAAAAGDNGEYPRGTGMYYTTAAGLDTVSQIIWKYLEQSVDSPKDSLAIFYPGKFRTLPVTTATANVTYDIAFTDEYIWTANWAGGLRRFPLSDSVGTAVWDRVPLPMDDQTVLETCNINNYESIGGNDILKDFMLNPRDPVDNGNNNHKVFSILTVGDTIWVGTANGINRGYIGVKGCVDWTHFSFPENGLSGNFVVDLELQDWNSEKTIWAATVFADNPSENNGVSYSSDNGLTWNSTLIGERVYNIFTSDSLIFAASENGVWKSTNGITWALFKPAKSSYNADEILTNIVYSGQVDSPPYYSDRILWLGTGDGLARSMDLQGSDWTIFRAEFDQNSVYAFPNPFVPRDDSVVRFHTDNKNSNVIEMVIYNFAMNRVYKGSFDVAKGTRYPKWNGRDDNGLLVANGVYFAKLIYDNKTEWAKLIVVK